MPDARSFEEFAAASQWVAIVFMTIAGANFALTYALLVRRRIGVVGRDEELRLYLLLLVGGSAVILATLWGYGTLGDEALFRHSVFQAVSVMTTTGFASVDFVAWPALAAMTLVALMFVGGSAGSTGGSVKVVRHLLLGKSLRREVRQTVHPEVVIPVRLNGLVVDERTLRAITSFILLYVGIWVAGTAVVAVDTAAQGPSLSPFEVIAATATTLGNVGPAFGVAGPMGSFEAFSDVSTIAMTILMWLGRLEVIPVVVLLTRASWRI
jgi:trk system potassium uptake protein TrkH